MMVIICKVILFVIFIDEDNFLENCVDNVFKCEVISCLFYDKQANTVGKWGC